MAVTKNLPYYRITHRTFYIGVGRSRNEKAQEIIDMVKKGVKEADAGKGIPEATFLDIYIPIWGDNAPTRLEFNEVDIPYNQLGKFKQD